MTDYRIARQDDETDVLALLEEVAPEVPVRLDGPERQEKIKITIRESHASGKSWVAIDAKGKVVGFALARPDVYEGKAAVYLRYVGVSAASRRQGIFSTLMDKLKASGVPITANVLHNNRSSMVDNLTKIGFTSVDSDDKQTWLRWLPPLKQGSSPR